MNATQTGLPGALGTDCDHRALGGHARLTGVFGGLVVAARSDRGLPEGLAYSGAARRS
jgi:hypothetical protein